MSNLIKEIQDLQKEINLKQVALGEKKALLKQQLAGIDLESVSVIRRGRKPGVKSAKPDKAVKVVKAPKAKRAKRGGSSEAILTALDGKALTTGELKTAINYAGANLSAVLAGMKKAGKIEKKDGKWSVKK